MHALACVLPLKKKYRSLKLGIHRTYNMHQGTRSVGNCGSYRKANGSTVNTVELGEI